MSPHPSDIKAQREQQLFEIFWSDDTVSRFHFVTLRGECGCALCVEEGTGRQLLDVSTIPPDISITGLEQVGNYAVRILWSDGHDTGLYSWERLYELGQAADS